MLFMIIPNLKMFHTDRRRFFAYILLDLFAVAVFILKMHHTYK
jgi:hypothetical protein